MLGVGVTSLGSQLLLSQRPSLLPAPWNSVAFGIFMISWLWFLWVTFPGALSIDAPHPLSKISIEKKSWFISGASIFILRWQWDQNWSVACLGPAAALALWSFAHAQRIKPYGAMVIWTFSGLAALQLPWPNPQRFLLTMVIGGLATILQGAFAFLHFYRILRQQRAEAC
jgi:hypothetical protein